MITKFDKTITSNVKYISPEEVIDSFEVGLIPAEKTDFVKNIAENAETVYPVVYNEFKGSFEITTKSGFGRVGDNKRNDAVVARNAETEIADKISALMSFYGDKIKVLSIHEIVALLNKVLNLSSVNSLSDVEISKKLGVLDSERQISPSNNITLSSQKDSFGFEKQ